MLEDAHFQAVQRLLESVLKASKASPRLTRLDISSRDLHRLSLTIVRHTGVAAEDSGVHHSEGLAQDSGPRHQDAKPFRMHSSR